LGVALGVAAGLLAHRYIPVEHIWLGLIIGLAVGISIFILFHVIRGKGNIIS
jgi:hypothetical protein